MISFNLNYLLNTVLSPNIVTLEVRALTYECWRDTVQSITVGKQLGNNAYSRGKQTVVHEPNPAGGPFLYGS